MFDYDNVANILLISVIISLLKAFGQLVLLGYDITAFTPAAYQRCSLQRPL